MRDLAEELSVDESTVRRHLSKLDELRMIQRSHGGATPRRPDNSLHAEPTPTNLREKQAIGQAAAERIHDGQVLLLDGGSTTLEVARSLRNTSLTVVTNDLRIGLTVVSKPGIQLVFLGGEHLPESTTIWGPTAVQQAQQLRADVAIFTGDAIADEGVFRNTSYELELQRTMLGISTEAFVVADSSKFHRKALFKMFPLDGCTAIITDKFLNPIRASQLPIPVIRVDGH